MTNVYDETGVGYSLTRRPDPRIATRIPEALDDAGSVLNIGAGSGSYEPRDRPVVAVEPSATAGGRVAGLLLDNCCGLL